MNILLRPLRTIGILTCLFLLVSRSLIQAASDQVDPLALAVRLIKDSHFDRAKQILSDWQADPTYRDNQGQSRRSQRDLARFFTIQGLYFLYKTDFISASTHLQKAVELGQNDPFIHIYRAQAFFGMDDFGGCLKALDQVPDLVEQTPSLILIQARSLAKTRALAKAYSLLKRGQAAFPKHKPLLWQRIRFDLEQNLLLSAREKVTTLLAQADLTAQDLKALAQTLSAYPIAHDLTTLVLEAGHLLEPGDLVFTTQLGRLYGQNAAPLAAAMLFEQAGAQRNRYYLESATLYARSGRLHQALLINSKLFEQKAKFKQRLALLIQLGQFAQAAGMQEALSRHGLLQQDDIRYALGYAYFKNGRYEAADKVLARLEGAQYFDKATALRQEMNLCQRHPLRCLL